jgi:UDPglucose 6-dehydrogenase
MEKPTVCVFGFGFLGRAFTHGFYLHANIKIYDKYDNSYDSLDDAVNSSRMIFVGVPTPMSDDGSQDLSNMDDAVRSIVRVAKSRKIIVLRSTIIPGTTRAYAEKYPEHDFSFMPEFLTERQAKLDFINSARFIFGGERHITNELEKFFRIRFEHTPIYHTTWEAAEMVKYMCNCFFAVKVSFMNEIYDMCEFIGIPYGEMKKMFLADARIGNSHCDVPGHDNLRGYGGKCFPKDVRAFIKWAEKNNLTADMCVAADKVNSIVREEEDWKDIKGATSAYDYKEGEKNN